MTAMRFLDTNILLYAVGLHPEDAAKQRIAEDLLNETENALSAQVLAEFYYQSTHAKRSSPLTGQRALDFVSALLRFPVAGVTPAIVLAGIAISTRFQLQYWDGAILAAARSMGCDSVYSEDLSATQDYDGLRVINPFV